MRLKIKKKIIIRPKIDKNNFVSINNISKIIEMSIKDSDIRIKELISRCTKNEISFVKMFKIIDEFFLFKKLESLVM